VYHKGLVERLENELKDSERIENGPNLASSILIQHRNPTYQRRTPGSSMLLEESEVVVKRLLDPRF
jgi:hypothetical protein